MNSLFLILKRVFDDLVRYNPAFYFAVVSKFDPINPYLHQVEFLARVMLRRPIRVLLADEIGLGKTISALSIVKRLISLGLASRVIVVVPRILINQWRNEISRIGLGDRLRLIEGYTINTLREERFPEGIYLSSMDLIKRSKYLEYLKDVKWDVIIVDEAHRLGAKRGRKTQRYSAMAKLITSNGDADVIFLTATPHRGDPEDYIERLRILDTYLIDSKSLDRSEFYKATHNIIVFRRTKIDINTFYEDQKIFPKCELNAVVVKATDEEKEFHRRIVEFLRTKILDFYNKMKLEPKALNLLIATIFKRASSSPHAAIITMKRIIGKRSLILQLKSEAQGMFTSKSLSKLLRLAKSVFGLSFDEYYDNDLDEEVYEPDDVLNELSEYFSEYLTDRDTDEIRNLISLAEKIKQKDSRLITTMKIIEKHVRNGDKIILFSEYKDTVNYIFENLKARLGEDSISIITSEQVSNGTAQSIIERFKVDNKLKVLIATDVASEGLNLQVANILINYEPPWSPVKLEQRIGRVWRLGQKKDVIVYNIFLGVNSDKDVLDVLYRKLIAMHRAIGEKKSILGEKTLVIDLSSENKLWVEIPINVEKNGRRVKPTEYNLIREYIEGGKVALDSLVSKIITAIENLVKTLKRLGVYPILNKNEILRIVETFTGFKDLSKMNQALLKLASIIADIDPRYGEISNRKETLRLLTPGGGISEIKSHWDSMKIILNSLSGVRDNDEFTPFIIVHSDRDFEVRIFSYEIIIEKDGKRLVLFKEPIGVDVQSYEVYRGEKLLELLTTLKDKSLEVSEFTVEEDNGNYNYNIDLEAKIKEFPDNIIRKIQEHLDFYRRELHLRGWRRKDNWCPSLQCQLKLGDIKLLGVIKSISRKAETRERELPDDLKKKIEEKAMEIAMNYEKSQGRIPIRVDDKEHYDILSKNKQGEIERIIEVKGHARETILAELTEQEYETAKREGERYWLYIIYNISTGKPTLIAVNNPLENMKIEVIEQKRIERERRFILIPK